MRPCKVDFKAESWQGDDKKQLCLFFETRCPLRAVMGQQLLSGKRTNCPWTYCRQDNAPGKNTPTIGHTKWNFTKSCPLCCYLIALCFSRVFSSLLIIHAYVVSKWQNKRMCKSQKGSNVSIDVGLRVVNSMPRKNRAFFPWVHISYSNCDTELAVWASEVAIHVACWRSTGASMNSTV